MKKLLYILLAFFGMTLTVTACGSSEEDVIAKFRELADELESDGDTYSLQEWQDAVEEYKNLVEEAQNYDFDRQQLRELGRQQGRCAAAIAKYAGRVTEDYLNGFSEGFGDY